MGSHYPILGLAMALFLGGASMAVGKTLTIASAMTGQLVDAAGAPVSGVTVVRTWRMNNKQGDESTVTDAEGRFAFPAAEQRSFFAAILPGTPVIDQQFTHDQNGSPAMFLRLTKLSFAPDAELEGRPLKVVCRVDAEPTPGPDAIRRSTCRIVD